MRSLKVHKEIFHRQHNNPLTFIIYRFACGIIYNDVEGSKRSVTRWNKVTCRNCWATRKITKRDTASGSGKIKFKIPKGY